MKHHKNNPWRFAVKYVYALVGAVYLLTFGLAKGKNRAFLGEIGGRIGWRAGQDAPRQIIPTLDPQKVFSGIPLIEIHDPVGDDGNVSLLELVILNKLVKNKNPQAIFEIGTFDGRTTLNLAANSNPDAKVFTLDLPPDQMEAARENPKGDYKFIGRAVTGEKFLRTPYKKQIVQLEGDSAVFDFSPYHQAMDFIFIDGAHSYSYVSVDTGNALKMRRQGGVIAWHDYRVACPGVIKVLNDLYLKGGDFRNLRWIKGTALVILAPSSLLSLPKDSVGYW